MYKPNFCSECGEKITRTRWRVWTSRSFCPNCERRYLKARILLPVIAAVALLSIGLALGRATRTQPPPLTVQRGEMSIAPLVSSKTGSDVEEAAATDTSASSAGATPEPTYGPNGTATERPTDPEEMVSLCGARTQKGTPCQRRVRGTGRRCWQHRGMPAILPPSRLVIQGQ